MSKQYLGPMSDELYFACVESGVIISSHLAGN